MKGSSAASSSLDRRVITSACSSASHSVLSTNLPIKAVDHQVLTYTEYRAVSGVFQTPPPPNPNYCPPTPSPTSECVLSPHQRRGVHTRRAVRGGGQYFGRRQTLDWPLQYNPSTLLTVLSWLKNSAVSVKKYGHSKQAAAGKRPLPPPPQHLALFTICTSLD